MGDQVTWVVLTDGYYFKLAFYHGQEGKIQVYREDDFEQSSEITYRLITRYRNQHPQSSNATDTDKNFNDQDFLFKLLGDFLSEKVTQGEFQNLVFVGPQSLIDTLTDYLPENVYNKIVAKFPGDFLALPQDKLETTLKTMISTKN